MAYAGTIAVKRLGKGLFELTITETGAGASDEKEIVIATQKLPKVGRIVSQESQKASGDATTLNPKLGHVTNPTLAADIVVANDTPAAAINNLPVKEIPYDARTGSLFHRAQPDAGTNNSITTRYKIRAGV